MTRGKRSGDEDDGSADPNKADGHQAKSSDHGGEDVEEKPQVYPELHTRRAHEQRGKGRGWWGKRQQGAGLRHDSMCSAMSHKPDPQPSQPPAVRAEVARMQAGAAPQPPSLASSATSADVSSPSSPASPETVRREGPGATGRQRGEGAVVGKGEGGEKRGQAEAGRGRAEGVAAGAEGQGEGQG